MEKPQNQQILAQGDNPRKTKMIKVVVPTIALAVAVAHALAPTKFTVDAATLGLIVIALLPWLGSFITSLKYGDLEITLQDLNAKTDEAKGAAESARRLAMAGSDTAAASANRLMSMTDAPVDSGMMRLEKLVDEYATTRRNHPPGDLRTQLMVKVLMKMFAVAPEVSAPEVLPWLQSRDHPHRLGAYAYLYARPDRNQFTPLARSVTGADNQANDERNPPFAEYWGILALQKVAAVCSPGAFQADAIALLRSLARQLQPGTDRSYELERLLRALPTRDER